MVPAWIIIIISRSSIIRDSPKCSNNNNNNNNSNNNNTNNIDNNNNNSNPRQRDRDNIDRELTYKKEELSEIYKNFQNLFKFLWFTQ